MLDLTPIKAKPKGQVYPFVFEARETQEHWEFLEPFIERSVRVSEGTVTTSIIRSMLAEDAAVCMGIARDGEPLAIIVARMIDYPHHRAARIIAAAGSELREAVRFWHVLEVWAHSQGATQVEAWCRPSMVRLLQRFGFRPCFTMVTRDLKRMLQ